jgi:hypothetical protein
MKTKKRWYCLGVGVAVGLGYSLMGDGPLTMADEPPAWCGTDSSTDQQVAQGECPTQGSCGLPAVRNLWIPGRVAQVQPYRTWGHDLNGWHIIPIG